jgi:hypothetical protein
MSIGLIPRSQGGMSCARTFGEDRLAVRRHREIEETIAADFAYVCSIEYANVKQNECEAIRASAHVFQRIDSAVCPSKPLTIRSMRFGIA